MNPREYDTMFRVEDRHWWYEGLRALLATQWKRYGPPDGARVLDVGCGTGANLMLLGQAARPVGVDIAPEAIRYTKSRGIRELARANALALPFPDQRFDAAISMDILYHRRIPVKVDALRELRRVMIPGARLFLNAAAYQWLFSSHDIHDEGDTRFTRTSLRRILREAGLTPLYATYWNSFLLPPIAALRLWRRYAKPAESDLADNSAVLSTVGRSALTLERALMRLTPLPAGVSIFIVAERPSE